MSKTNVRTDFDRALKQLITEVNNNYQDEKLDGNSTALVLHELRKQFATKLEVAQKVELSHESAFAIFTARISIQTTIGNKTELCVLSENSMFAPKESLLESSVQAQIQKEVLDSTVSALGVISHHKNNRALEATSKDTVPEIVVSEQKSSENETGSSIIVNSDTDTSLSDVGKGEVTNTSAEENPVVTESKEPVVTESKEPVVPVVEEPVVTVVEEPATATNDTPTEPVENLAPSEKPKGRSKKSNKSKQVNSPASSTQQGALNIINDMSDTTKEKPISDKGMDKIRELCKEAGITPEIAFLCMRPNRRPNKVGDLTDKMGYRITSAIKSGFSADDWKKKVQKEYSDSYELLKRKGAQKVIDALAIKAITSPESVDSYIETATAKQLFELHIKITAAVNRLKNQD